MKHRILVVDDDISVSECLRKVLEEAGHITVLAQDGLEALARLKEQEFDLLLLDLDLPNVSGWDILDFVVERYRPVPVVILSGMADQCEPGALVDVDALFEKPPDIPVLLRTIDTLLSESGEQRLQAKFSQSKIREYGQNEFKAWPVFLPFTSKGQASGSSSSLS